MWYEKLAKHSLDFRPAFRSITEFQIPRMKSLTYCTSKLPLLRTCGDEWAHYTLHPITLDAMLQTAIVATTAGDSKDFRAKVPTKIGTAAVETSEIFDARTSSRPLVGRKRGIWAAEIGAEVVQSKGHAHAQLESVRLALYEVTSQVEAGEKRHPML